MQQDLNFNQRIEAFKQLRTSLSKLPNTEIWEPLHYRISSANGWFTKENTWKAIEGIMHLLSDENLTAFESKYAPLFQNPDAKVVGVVMAGNLPFVGFLDAFCVLVSGNKLQARFSSTDSVLPAFVLTELIRIQPAFAPFIEITERLANFQAVIATGSDNSARYFEQYFGKYPHIIRRNRSSVAVLSGKETPDHYALLANDIANYFGLGCRNVSKLLVPQHWEHSNFFEAFEPWKEVLANHNKYFNNYEYQKSLLLINKKAHLDCGFLMLTESKEFVSPISVIFVERYQNATELQEQIERYLNKTQCISTEPAWLEEFIGKPFPQAVAFGNTQNPNLNDYPDGIDVMHFLSTLS